MDYLRTKVVTTATKYLGYSVENGRHKVIVDRYNKQNPLPRGYKVKYSDAWCATFVSAVFLECGYNNIPFECSCAEMVKGFQKMGRWQENDDYAPKPGDVIFYDWEDVGKGDNTGHPDHVGIVSSVEGRLIRIIEGNYNNKVATRRLCVGGRYIRGYGTPEYTETKEIPYGTSKQVACSATVTADALNVRTWAGVEYKNVLKNPVLHKGDTVEVCGYVYSKSGDKWYYIYTGHSYGFVSGRFVRV